MIETIVFKVFEVSGERDITIFTDKLVIDEAYFMRLVNLPADRSRRNRKLLDIAAKMMPELEK